ncbi:alcohol oxidase [Marasmius fiardii PR-910]|nr:alcohol oxidase [Marasmius fiardii PR-910]
MSDPTTTSYDFVIIGGGTAGSVVAARLSEDPNITVCVLEAGNDNTYDQEVQVPGFGFKNLGRPDILWPFTSVPQPFANDRTLSHLRGKSLGGSSAINLLVAVRGHAAEIDAYETLGNDGWNWSNLLPYFQKSETHTVTSENTVQYGAELNTAYHGTDGPIHRTFAKWTTPVLSQYFETMKSLGYHYNKDPYNGDNSGVWPSQFAIHATDSVRTFAASGYLKPAEKRTNLHVFTGAHVSKVILDSDKQQNGLVVAEGVEYKRDGKTFRALAKKEVILCAGAYQSPQILELSDLEKSWHNMSCRSPWCWVQLPYDHYWCSFTAELRSNVETLDVLLDPARAAQEWDVYAKTKGGLLSTNLGGFGFAMLSCNSFMDKDKFENLKAEASKLHSTEYEKVANLHKKWLADGKVPFLELVFIPGFMPAIDEKPQEGKKYLSCFISNQHPFSRGTVHIASPDPSAAPTIDPRVLDNKVDMCILVESIKFVRRIFASGEFKETTKEVIPDVSSDEELENFVRRMVQTVFHPIGTASMLPREDGGVVDSDLRVYGTANLRVVDASVMPIHISGHPMLTIYAIAEKAADTIKSSYA